MAAINISPKGLLGIDLFGGQKQDQVELLPQQTINARDYVYDPDAIQPYIIFLSPDDKIINEFRPQPARAQPDRGAYFSVMATIKTEWQDMVAKLPEGESRDKLKAALAILDDAGINADVLLAARRAWLGA